MHCIVSKRAAASFIDYRSSPMIQLRGVDRRDEVVVIIAPAASAAPGQQPADTAADGSEDRPYQAATRSRDRAPQSTAKRVRRPGVAPRDLLKLFKRKLFHF